MPAGPPLALLNAQKAAAEKLVAPNGRDHLGNPLPPPGIFAASGSGHYENGVWVPQPNDLIPQHPLPQAQPAPEPEPIDTTDTGTGGGSGTLGSLLQPYNQPMPTPQPVNLQGIIPPTPEFHAPPGPTPPPDFSFDPFQGRQWTPTTEADVLADPSYDFRRKTGEQPIIHSAAARGMARTGNSLIDLLKYNQDFAATDFSNIDARRRDDFKTGWMNDFNTWGANLHANEDKYNMTWGTRKDVADREMQSALAEFQPQMEGYATQAQAGQRMEEDNWDRAFKVWQQDFDINKFNKQWPYNVLSDQQRLGLTAAQG